MIDAQRPVRVFRNWKRGCYSIMQDGRIIQYGTPEEIVGQPATDYVRAFVANVNPLNVLRGESLMSPTSELDRDAGAPELVFLEPTGRYRCRLDGTRRPAASVPAQTRSSGRPFQVARNTSVT